MEPDATTPAESSPAIITITEAEVPAIESLTSEQRDKWLETGKYPDSPKSEESAPSQPSEEAASEAEKPEPVPESETGQKTQEPQPRKAKGAEHRKAELAAEIQSLLKQRQELRQELEGRAATQESPDATPELEEPSSDDYETYEDYIKALGQFSAKQELAKQQKAQQEARRQEEEQKREEAIKQTWTKRVEDASKRIPDLAEAMIAARDKKIARNSTMDGFVLDSDHGPELLYTLFKNPEEAARIASLEPYATVREMHNLELSISGKAPKQKTYTTASPPPSEISGNNAAPLDEAAAAVAAGDFARYKAAADARDQRSF